MSRSLLSQLSSGSYKFSRRTRDLDVLASKGPGALLKRVAKREVVSSAMRRTPKWWRSL